MSKWFCVVYLSARIKSQQKGRTEAKVCLLLKHVTEAAVFLRRQIEGLLKEKRKKKKRRKFRESLLHKKCGPNSMNALQDIFILKLKYG